MSATQEMRTLLRALSFLDNDGVGLLRVILTEARKRPARARLELSMVSTHTDSCIHSQKVKVSRLSESSAAIRSLVLGKFRTNSLKCKQDVHFVNAV